MKSSLEVFLYYIKGKSFWNVSEERNDSCTWKALLEMRSKVRPFFMHSVGNGKDIAIWSDNWCTIGHMSQIISNSMLSDARIKDNCALVDMINNGTWCWPEEWTQIIPVLTRIPVPRLNENKKDEVKKKDIIEKVAKHPCNNAIRSVVRRITLATTVYYIWKERNSRIFNDTKVPCENVLQMIMENIRLQIQRLQVKKSKECFQAWLVLHTTNDQYLVPWSDPVVTVLIGPLLVGWNRELLGPLKALTKEMIKDIWKTTKSGPVPSHLLFLVFRGMVVGNYRIVIEKYWYTPFVVEVGIVERAIGDRDYTG
ncbi:hypothetical protein Tco_1144252 [Tanacetum coccineum]